MIRDRKLAFVLILGTLGALGPLSIDAYLPALPQLAVQFGASEVAVQLSITACLVGLGIGQVIGGPVSDAHGRRAPLLAALALYAANSLLCAFAGSIWVMIAARLLQGIGGGGAIVIANAVVRDRSSGAAAGRYFSLLLLVSGLAPILAPLAGGLLLRVAAWPAIFTSLAGIAVVLLASVALFLPETLELANRRTGGLRDVWPTYARVLSERRFAGCMLACGLAFAAMFAYIAGSSFVLQNVHGFSPQAYSVVFGVNALGLVAVAQAGGAIVARVGAQRLLGVGVTCSATGGCIMLAAAHTPNSVVPLLLGMFVVVASVGLVMPNAMALALTGHGDAAGSAAALMGLATYFTGALSAPLAGIGGASSAQPMAASIAALGMAAFVSYVTIVARDRRSLDTAAGGTHTGAHGS